MVYLVCAVKVPTGKEQEEGKVEELIGELKAIVAKNEQMAGIKYIQEHLPNAKLDNVEVIVGPFVKR